MFSIRKCKFCSYFVYSIFFCCLYYFLAKFMNFKMLEAVSFLFSTLWQISGFPHSSVRKESTCNAGDPGLIPGLGRSVGEGIGYPLQYTWTFLVAQLVKNLPAMWETQIQSLGSEDPLEKGKITHSSILAWRIPWTVQSIGSQRVRHD